MIVLPNSWAISLLMYTVLIEVFFYCKPRYILFMFTVSCNNLLAIRLSALNLDLSRWLWQYGFCGFPATSIKWVSTYTNIYYQQLQFTESFNIFSYCSYLFNGFWNGTVSSISIRASRLEQKKSARCLICISKFKKQLGVSRSDIRGWSELIFIRANPNMSGRKVLLVDFILWN